MGLERANRSAFGVKATALNLLDDWRKAQGAANEGGCQVGTAATRWSKPPAELKKINVDAALFSDGSIGLGSVIRDSIGQFLRARCGRVNGRWQPTEVEALNLKEALLWAKDLKLDHCIFEADSKNLVEACKWRKGVSYFHTIVSDCIELCKHFNHVRISFVGRSVNSVAHVLATHSVSDQMEWVVNPPDFIKHVLDSDLF
ncbi:uncharacterized protein LOC141683717 [Apium graveolens]|uniref:uncharacterized protein LOC141683717 n=1 Tax=Apium graveolens TaxID=4045 RepID=UPI003D7BB422